MDVTNANSVMIQTAFSVTIQTTFNVTIQSLGDSMKNKIKFSLLLAGGVICQQFSWSRFSCIRHVRIGREIYIGFFCGQMLIGVSK